MFSGVDRIPACDGQTDGQTSCDSVVRAMHTRRAVKTVIAIVVKLTVHTGSGCGITPLNSPGGSIVERRASVAVTGSGHYLF